MADKRSQHGQNSVKVNGLSRIKGQKPFVGNKDLAGLKLSDRNRVVIQGIKTRVEIYVNERIKFMMPSILCF